MSDLDGPSASRKFGMVMCVDPLNHMSACKILFFLNIQHGGQLLSGKYKKHDISEIIWTYFSRILVCIFVLPSLCAIKCTVTDNKTANINDKKTAVYLLR